MKNKMNMDHMRNSGRNGMDVDMSMNLDKDGRAHAYKWGKEPDVERQDNVKVELFYANR